MVTERQPQTHAGPDRGRPLVRVLMVLAAVWLALTLALFAAGLVEILALRGALFLFGISASAVWLNERTANVLRAIVLASFGAALLTLVYERLFPQPPDGVTPIEDAVFVGTIVMLVLALVGLALPKRMEVKDGR